MTEPTKEEYKALADILGDALDHCNEVRLYGDNLFTAYKALRLAANLPSEDKIATTICQSGRFETGEGVCAAICMDQLGNPRNSGCRHAKIVHKRLAARILERIRSVK